MAPIMDNIIKKSLHPHRKQKEGIGERESGFSGEIWLLESFPDAAADILNQLLSQKYPARTFSDRPSLSNAMAVEKPDLILLHFDPNGWFELDTFVQLGNDFGPFRLVVCGPEDRDWELSWLQAGALEYLGDARISDLDFVIRKAMIRPHPEAKEAPAQSRSNPSQPDPDQVCALFRNLPEVVLFVDAGENINYLNKPELLPGGKQEPGLLADLFQGDSLRLLRRALKAALIHRVNQSFSNFLQLPHFTGWFKFQIVPLVDGDTVYRFVIIVENISTQRQTEETLRSERDLVNQIMQTSIVAIILMDPKGYITFANKKAEEILDLDPQMILRRHFNTRDWQLSDFEGRPIPEEKLPVRRIMENGVPVFDMELSVYLHSGKRVILSLNAAPIKNSEGDITSVVCFFSDITQRYHTQATLQESKKRYKAFIDAIPDQIFRIDSKGDYLDVEIKDSDDIATPVSEWIGLNIRDFFPPEKVEEALAVIDKALYTGDIQIYEYQLPDKEGRYRVYEARIAPSGIDQVLVIARDITDRKRIEVERLEQRTFLESIFQGVDLAICVLGLDEENRLHFVDVNPAGMKLAGLDRSMLVGKTLQDLSLTQISREAQARFASFLRTCIIKSRSIQFIQEVRLGEREMAWLVTFTPLLDAHKRVYRIIATAVDLTDQVEVEKKLEQSNQRFAKLSANVPGMLYQFIMYPDGNYDFQYVSEGSYRLFGLAPEDFLKKSEALFDYLHPEDRRGFVETLYQSAQELRPWNWEGRAVFRKETRWFYGISQPERFANGSVLWNGFLMDITERKDQERAQRETEEKYRRLFEETNDVVFYCNTDGELNSVNPAALTLLGYDTIGDILGRNLARDFFVNPAAWAHFRKEIEGTGGTVQNFDTILKHSGGQDVHVLISASVVRENSGIISGYRGFMRDITDRKQLERRLNQAQKMEAIGTLAGGIAHDFNNILAAILGYAELTREDVRSHPVLFNNLDQIYKAGMRAKELTKQILTFSHHSQREKKPLLIHIVVKEVLKLLRASLPSTVEVIDQIDPRAGVVLADPNQIHQLVLNLCTNAHQAMPGQKGTLTVNLRRREVGEESARLHPNLSAGEYITLEIIDNGEGMDEKTLERIFDPFFTTKPAGKGTGMGLAVVHGVVSSHGGAITVKSRMGEGSHFTVYFPSFSGQAIDQEDVEHPIPTGHENIVVIDDEMPVADTLSKLLARLGYQVKTYTDSRQARDWIEEHPGEIDLLITDQTMPNLTGVELVNDLRQLFPELPVILLTGYSEVISKETALNSGIQDFLYKPVMAGDLGIAVRQVLDSRR